MASHRPFPPSPRRLALARAAGLHAASPILVGALACSAAVIALAALGHVTSARLGEWIAAACDGRATAALGPGELAGAALETATPILVVSALAAVTAHLAQTRALWLPRRRLPNAPQRAPRRGTRASLDLASAAVIGAVAFGWLWRIAPRLGGLTRSPGAGGLLIASFACAIAVARVALGTIDALIHHVQLTRSLRMTATDRRDDERLAGADPRWRARRASLANGPSTRDAVAGASLVVLGDDAAVAIAWDPIHRPVPVRTAAGRAARATQLLGLARRHAIPVHRDVALAAALADGEGPVSESLWPRLAEITAATRGRSR